MSAPLRERLWLYRIRSRRDPEAYASIYDRYVAQLYRFVLFKVEDEETAKELTSDSFMKAWEYLTGENQSALSDRQAGGRQVKSVSGLLYTIARTSVADHYRKKKLETVSLDDSPDAVDLRSFGQAERNEEVAATLAAMKKLKDEYREALFMKHIDGLANDEIASALGKNNGAVRVLIHRATQALKEVMQK
jgi:RNA polymerase sigma-70 factor, ECF subfamily